MTKTPLPEKWPINENAMGVNQWNRDSALFVKIVQENPNFWHMDHGIKYLNVRIDTRDGAFLLIADGGNAEEKNRISPDRVLNAIREYRERMR